MSKSNQRIYFKELRVQQYRALAHLLQHSSFEQAGRALSLSRTSIWRQVRALERDIGCQLVTVEGRLVSLTPDGRLLAELAQPFIGDFDRILTEFHHQRAATGQRLTVATTPQLLNYELPEPIRTLRLRYPQLDLSFTTGASGAALQMLLKDTADVAIIGQRPELDGLPGCTSELVTAYPFVALLPPGHPLIAQRRVTATDLAACPLILPCSYNNSRIRIDAVFKEAGIRRKNVVLETDHYSSALPYVRMGLGIALISLSPVFMENELQPAEKRGEFGMRLLTHIFGEEKVFFVTKKISASRPCIADFQELVGESVSS